MKNYKENEYKNTVLSLLDDGKLTNNEIKLLQVLFNTGYRKHENGTVETLGDDGTFYDMCWMDYDYYCEKTNWKMTKLKGVVGNLVKKNLIWAVSDDEGFSCDNKKVYWLELSDWDGDEGVLIGSDIFVEIKSKLNSL